MGGQYASILLYMVLHCSLSFIVSREAYQCMIQEDYRWWTFGKTEEEKAENMKEIWDWVDNNVFKSVDTTSYKSVTARMIGMQSQLTKLVRFYHKFWLFINLLFQCQTIKNLDEIIIISAIIYYGLDPAGKQLLGIFTGPPIFWKLIDNNNVDIWKVLDRPLHSSRSQWITSCLKYTNIILLEPLKSWTVVSPSHLSILRNCLSTMGWARQGVTVIIVSLQFSSTINSVT